MMASDFSTVLSTCCWRRAVTVGRAVTWDSMQDVKLGSLLGHYAGLQAGTVSMAVSWDGKLGRSRAVSWDGKQGCTLGR